MNNAQNLLARNLASGKYKIVKEGKRLSKTICYLSVDNNCYLFTNESGSHQMLPIMEFKYAISVIVENGYYALIAKSALSMWAVRDREEQKQIINMIEDLVLNHIVYEDGK